MEDRSLAWCMFTVIRTLAQRGMSDLDILVALQIYGLNASDMARIRALTDEELDRLDSEMDKARVQDPVRVQVDTEQVKFLIDLQKRNLSRQEMTDALAKWREEHPFRPPNLIDFPRSKI